MKSLWVLRVYILLAHRHHCDIVSTFLMPLLSPFTGTLSLFCGLFRRHQRTLQRLSSSSSPNRRRAMLYKYMLRRGWAFLFGTGIFLSSRRCSIIYHRLCRMSFAVSYGATPIIGETVCECVSYLYRYRRESNEYRKIFKAPPTSFEEALRRKLYIVVPAQQGVCER